MRPPAHQSLLMREIQNEIVSIGGPALADASWSHPTHWHSPPATPRFFQWIVRQEYAMPRIRDSSRRAAGQEIRSPASRSTIWHVARHIRFAAGRRGARLGLVQESGRGRCAYACLHLSRSCHDAAPPLRPSQALESAGVDTGPAQRLRAVTAAPALRARHGSAGFPC